MSQASNKVKWCLNKSASLHLVKARHNLKAALFFQKNNYSDWSASAFFYCVYHCFLAVLRKFGYESRNQECTIAVMEMLKEQGKIEIDGRFISTLKISQAKEDEHSIIKIREDFQYGTDVEFHRKEEFEKLAQMCKEAIEATNKIIFSK